jgi:hypothetical protein
MRRSHSTAELLMRSGPRLPRPLPSMSYAMVGTATGARTATHAERGAIVWPVNAEVANVGTNAVMLFEKSGVIVVAVLCTVAWRARADGKDGSSGFKLQCKRLTLAEPPEIVYAPPGYTAYRNCTCCKSSHRRTHGCK